MAGTEDKCRYCKRTKFASPEEYAQDIDAKENKCGRDVAGREGAADCMSERLHRSEMRRMRAESLLETAALLHLMGQDYRDRFRARYDAFRADDGWQP